MPNPQVIGLIAAMVVAVALCAAPVALVLLVLRHRQAAAAQRFKAALDLAERGVQVPPQLLLVEAASRKPGHGDLRLGLILASGGVGIIAFALTLPHHAYWGIGLIPLFAGLGYLATWHLSKAERATGDDA